MPQISRNVPARPSTVAPMHSPSMAMLGSRDPPRTSAATARNSSSPATHSAASPPRDRRTGKRSDNPSGYQLGRSARQGAADDIRRTPRSEQVDSMALLRIALNAQLLSFADNYRSGGISRVIYHLLAELGRDPRGHTFDVFVPSAPERNGWGSLTFHPSGQHTVRPPIRIAWEQTVLPRKLASLKPDLLHGLAYALPIGWSGPGVVTIYDLSFLRFPDAFKPANRIYLTATTRATARRA